MKSKAQLLCRKYGEAVGTKGFDSLLLQKEAVMQEKIYLLSLREALPEQSGKGAQQESAGAEAVQGIRLHGEAHDVDGRVLGQMLAKLDQERLAKVNRIKSPAKKLESAGGGLLLQLAVQEALAGEGITHSICLLSISGLLNAIPSSLHLEYSYNRAGKPYLKDYPYFFSLSHSGEYVLCAISDEEIGVDIQEMKPCDAEKIGERFFAEEEKEKLRRCRNERERLDCFYEIWSGKEAYGKMTGEGVGKVLGVNISQSAGQHTGQPARPLVRQLAAPFGYKIAVCAGSPQKSFRKGDAGAEI